VTGSVAAEQWRATEEWPRAERFIWPAPIEAEYGRYNVIALEVEDDSVDLLYPSGALLTCVSFTELGRSPRSGERVVVHRLNEEGLIEITVREYQVDDTRRAWLVSRSSRPNVTNIALGEHDAPLPDGIKIPYRVTGSFIRE
jgi:repressor LexA